MRPFLHPYVGGLALEDDETVELIKSVFRQSEH